LSWLFVLTLSAGAYLLKLLGFVALPRLSVTERAAPLVALLPPALLAALVVVGTFERAGAFAIDERVLGMLAALIAVVLRAPLVVIIVVAPLVTALVRML
jgi:branched-subunit amino acid transport protein